MFEIANRTSEMGSTQARIVATLASLAGQSILLLIFLVLPILYITDALPEPPVMMAFVAAPPAPPPPPPPPAPVARATTPVVKPVATSGRFAAPIEVPTSIAPESGIEHSVEGGVVGGVEGGVPGGVVGGIVGGLPSELPPPPPPPPPAPVARKSPVRIGGDVKAPALLERVAPIYPELAVMARAQGVVILEATVSAAGRVEEVRVLRSIPLLDLAAIDAVKAWRYSPLMLNGVPAPFILTVTVSFSIPEPKS